MGNSNPSFFPIAEELFNKKLLFSTPFKVDSHIQKELIEYVIRHGEPLPPEDDVPPFWVGMGLTDIVNKELTRNVAPENQGWWRYLSRLDDQIEWRWHDDPAAQMVQELLIPLKPFFKRFTRVTLVIQIPGCDLPAHRDIVVGDVYDNMHSPHATSNGDQRLLFKGKEWFTYNPTIHNKSIHKKQLYLNMKIPLSPREDSPGHPFIIKNAQKIFYSSKNKIFFLNEAHIEHGAARCPFHRGVVFVDGLFDLERFDELPREHVEILNVEAL